MKLHKNFFMRLTLIDRTLIIIMCILMIQIAVSLLLFYDSSETIKTNDIDIVVRTTAAAVFGYFLSGNFTRRLKPRSDCPLTVEAEDRKPTLKEEQVVIVSIFGISALIILILARDFLPFTPYVQSSVSQLRDFVSSCVGFLVGSPCKNRTQTK
ncbi:hypothetical protein lbkm_3880 [Lachnospiraceae bacterium KM106-2]|nr:hypothetical protein lbkm_3880 [Lachnospiraceae bacterium KM106-2]